MIPINYALGKITNVLVPIARLPWMALNGPETPMCLGVPMQIIEIDGFVARCTAKGVERDVSLFLLQDESLARGDFVMVHVGYAIQKMTQQDARSTWELIDEMLRQDLEESHA